MPGFSFQRKRFPTKVPGDQYAKLPPCAKSVKSSMQQKK
uniref:Uncharacterized protein n=1 Tax=Rhizophora mucronata TaxID=61149 RepID=A0A2P2J9I9_RHIMU